MSIDHRFEPVFRALDPFLIELKADGGNHVSETSNAELTKLSMVGLYAVEIH